MAVALPSTPAIVLVASLPGLRRPSQPELTAQQGPQQLWPRVQGLRTLMVGSRVLDANWFAAWDERYEAAKNLLAGREESMDGLAREVEADLELLGATAIEDKLQARAAACARVQPDRLGACRLAWPCLQGSPSQLAMEESCACASATVWCCCSWACRPPSPHCWRQASGCG